MVVVLVLAVGGELEQIAAVLDCAGEEGPETVAEVVASESAQL